MGLEPTRLAALVPETSASTNSATSAARASLDYTRVRKLSSTAGRPCCCHLHSLRRARQLTAPGPPHILLYALRAACSAASTLRSAIWSGPRGTRVGGLAERLKATVLKTVVGRPTGGSNPSPSAKLPAVTAVHNKSHLERWVSGLNHSPAKTAYSKGTESSNLSLSANAFRCSLTACACSSAG